MNYRKYLPDIIVLIIAAIVIGGALFNSPGSTGIKSSEKNISTLTVEQVKNATYDLHYMSPENGFGPVTLKEGTYKKEYNPAGKNVPAGNLPRWNYSLQMKYENTGKGSAVAFGDLDGDGDNDAAVILYENAGGNGYYAYLAVLQNQQGNAHFLDAVDIDDGPIIRDLKIANGEIILSAVVHKSTDGRAIPTDEKVFRYKLSGNKIISN